MTTAGSPLPSKRVSTSTAQRIPFPLARVTALSSSSDSAELLVWYRVLAQLVNDCHRRPAKRMCRPICAPVAPQSHDAFRAARRSPHYCSCSPYQRPRFWRRKRGDERLTPNESHGFLIESVGFVQLIGPAALLATRPNAYNNGADKRARQERLTRNGCFT